MLTGNEVCRSKHQHMCASVDFDQLFPLHMPFQFSSGGYGVMCRRCAHNDSAQKLNCCCALSTIACKEAGAWNMQHHTRALIRLTQDTITRCCCTSSVQQVLFPSIFVASRAAPVHQIWQPLVLPEQLCYQNNLARLSGLLGGSLHAVLALCAGTYVLSLSCRQRAERG